MIGPRLSRGNAMNDGGKAMILKDRVAVVTGGSRGIGRTIATTLASRGANIAFCDMNEATFAEVLADLEKLGVQAIAHKADVTNAADIDAFADAAMKRFGRVDILVNNAGITKDNLLIRMSEADWDAVLSVNLKGAFLATKAFIRPMMKARYGRIVNISSIIGVRGNAGQANYSASKAGIIGLTKSTAREFAGRQITCNAVAPGFIQTEMTRKLPENVIQEMLKQIPLNYLGETDDVARLTAFLASDEARYITGQVVCVDGGMVI
jgi:3-oxoacyl-[acyl-carrier protein] reductase